MGGLISAILIITAACVLLGFINAGRTQWAAGLAGAMLLVSIFTGVGGFWLLLGWLAVAGIVLLLLNEDYRKQLLTRPLLQRFREQVPAMSATEQEALEAGDTGWEAELFRGDPDWRKLEALKPALSDEERAFLDGPVEELCRMVDDWQITHDLHDLPEAVWDFIRKKKFFAMIIPKEHGGLGFSEQGHSAVIVKLASRSITAAVTVMVPNSLGPGQLLLEYGTEEQKKRYLPGLVSGEEIPCFALTAPEAGSDATGMVDHGVVCRQSGEGGEDVIGIRLNWNKRYITLGPVATLLGLAFKLYDPDHLLGEEEDIGITLALIPTDTPGVEIGRRHMPGAIPFQNGPNSGQDVFIPLDWIIGGPDYAGKGWRMLVECLSVGRGISLPGLGVAGAKLAAYTTTAYAQVRKQFRTPLSNFEGVEEALARIVGKTYLMEGARQLTLCMLDSGIRPSVATAIVKYHLTEMMREVINDAMDVHGGKAIMLGPTNYLMRIYQALPVAITVEGANILTRNMIIFGQGAMRCHPCLMEEIGIAARGEEGLDACDEMLGRHVAYATGNLARAFIYGLTRGVFTSGGSGRHKLEHLSAALAVSAELVLLLVGGRLKQRERLSARLGDALSYLYLGSAALHQFENNGRPQAEQPACDWAVTFAACKTQDALIALADNLPLWAGTLLKMICFPWGRRYKLPGDKLDHTLVRSVLQPGSMRDRLIDGIYIPLAGDQALRQLQQAFELAHQCEPVERKIRQARRDGRIEDDSVESALTAGIIDQDEADLLDTAVKARQKVIQVDDFATREYAGGSG